MGQKVEQIIFKKRDKIPRISVVLKKSKAIDKAGYLRIRINHPVRKSPFLCSMSYKIPVADWDARNKKVRHTNELCDKINTQISLEIARLNFAFKNYLDKGGEITEDAITAIISGKTVKEGDFLSFIRAQIEKKAQVDKDGVPGASTDYIKHLWVEYRRVYEYSKGRLPFSAINRQWIDGYENWLRPKLKSTTLSVKIKRLLEFIKLAEEYGHISTKNTAGYKRPKYLDPERMYLTDKQVEDIANLVYKKTLDNDPKLRAIACYFVIECYSGLRFSDWNRFVIETVFGEPALKVRTKKNKEPVYLYLKLWPRLSKMCKYIEKHGVVFCYTLKETNAGIATLRHLAKIPFEITTHNGRHTAATLLAMMGYSDIEGSEVLGISAKTFSLYRGATRQDSRLAQKRLGGI